jgi:hypothetical protein
MNSVAVDRNPVLAIADVYFVHESDSMFSPNASGVGAAAWVQRRRVIGSPRQLK